MSVATQVASIAEDEVLPERRTGRRWLVSPTFDLGIITLPLVIAFSALALLPDEGFGKPLWAYIGFIVTFDVAHVWSTGYLTYFDRVAYERRRTLLNLLPLACFIAAFALHSISATLFWSLLAYFAIYHFTKQQFGFIALYKARAGERDRFDFQLDKGTLWVGAMGPVALWHADPGEYFDWFDSGEAFALRLPEASMPWVHVIMLAVGAFWILRQAWNVAHGQRANLGKWLWMGASWLTWYLGIRVAGNFFVAAAFLNLFHGIPYMALVWYRVRANPELRKRRDRGLTVRLSEPRRWALFYLLVFAIALTEETLWDWFVWGDFIPLYEPDHALGQSIFLSFWIALLSLPQTVHYFLDGVLWKMNPSNQDFRDSFGF